MTETVETRVARIWSGDDGIGRVVFLPDVVVSLADATEYVAACRDLSHGKRSPVLIDGRHVRSIRREARTFLASDAAAAFTSAVGVIVASPLSRIIGSIFLGWNIPRFPVRLFGAEAEALEWLRRFL
jgi:hypothetical protein